MTPNPQAASKTRPSLVWDKNIGSYSEQKSQLWKVVQQCTGSPGLIDFVVKNIIKPQNVPGNDPVALARAVQKFGQDNIKFFRESPERWQSPSRTIAWGIGDCDDKTILIACILRSFRMPVQLIFVRFTNPQGVKQGHVFPAVYVGGKWVCLESVRPVPFGFKPIPFLRKRGAKIEKIEHIGDKAA